MQILLVRHGNTFEEGAPCIRIGSKTDLPLTSGGGNQAKALGAFLKNFKIPVAMIYSGPMLRHRQHSEAIASAIGLSRNAIIIDDRLQEIDYGIWEGKSDEDIEKANFGRALNDWNAKGIWPSDGIWGDTKESIQCRVKNFLESAKQAASDDTVLVVVTSGGVLRCFYEQAVDLNSINHDMNSKVSTGHVSSIDLLGLRQGLFFWNVPPDNLPALVSAYRSDLGPS